MLPCKPALVLALMLGGIPSCATQKATEPATRVSPVTAPLDSPAPFEPAGIGSLEARGGTGDASLVRLTRVHVVAEQRGDMAQIEATHTFQNESDATLEGTFRFPLPDGALLTGLAMMIDGRLMEGELVERDKARKVYETIVDSMQDPALLEWEHGSVFKLRVFPIEARREKVVKMRYLMPLRPSGDELELVQATRGPAGPLPLLRLSIDWQGQRVFDERDVGPERVLAFAGKPASAVLREQRADGAYAVVRVSPDWSRIPWSPPTPAKNWFVVVDTSRSALEEMPRALEALSTVLARLPAGARFQLITSDLDARAAAQGLVEASPQSIALALEHVKRVSPDGASDLGRALTLVKQLGESVSDSALLYLGDCEPTWGVTQPEPLLALLRTSRAPFHALLLGASVNDDLAAELSQQSGGRRARVRRREDLDAFAATLGSGVPVLHDIEVRAAAGTQVLANGPLSLEKGRELVLLLKAPAGRDPVAGLSVKARLSGRELDLLPRSPAQDAPDVARRFGAALVRKLEKANSPAADIVAASLSYGVMSKLTSFLVLESEEAYARHAIARQQAEAADGPRVTGQNLESTSGADISANRVQPGDPEIYVEAARDALSVKVELPFGETKVARFDPEARGGQGAWMVRFLVPRDTAEGDYDALAHIQHHDGSLETRKVRYTVDNTAPALRVELKRAARQPGMVEIIVTQADQAVRSDLKRVELRTPSGRVHQLTAIRWGTFRAFVPERELGAGTLRVVGFDQALNHSVKELQLP